MTVLTIRSGKRYAVRQDAFVQSATGQYCRALLIELSQEGARLSGLGAVSFATGDGVTVEVGTASLPAVVRWSQPGIIGVRFTQALYMAELSGLISRSVTGERPAGRLVAA